jgi:hypothetical protein
VTLLLIVLLVAYGMNVGVGAAMSAAEASSLEKVVDTPTVAPAALIPPPRTPGAAAWIATGRDPNAQRAIINASGANGFAAPPIRARSSTQP